MALGLSALRLLKGGLDMKAIKPSPGKIQWPRWKVSNVECRKKDLVLRITDWGKDKGEPGYDVEVYIGGVYDWHESTQFCLSPGLTTPTQAKQRAIKFAQEKIAQLL